MIANYVDWTPEKNFYCGDRAPGMRSYCHPDVYHGQPATLFRGNGDGTFTDVSESSRVGATAANGLGVVTFDYDNMLYQFREGNNAPGNAYGYFVLPLSPKRLVLRHNIQDYHSRIRREPPVWKEVTRFEALK